MSGKPGSVDWLDYLASALRRLGLTYSVGNVQALPHPAGNRRTRRVAAAKARRARWAQRARR